MFQIGDIIIYSVHGLCHIDDICEKTVAGVTRPYYVMHPLGDVNLVISCPVDSGNVMMHKTLEREEAKQILDSFRQPGVRWIEDFRQRAVKYKELIKTGDRQTIAKIVNSLMLKNVELQTNNKHLYEADRKMLMDTQHILFKDISLALDTTYEDINEQIDQMVQENFAAVSAV